MFIYFYKYSFQELSWASPHFAAR